MSVGSTGVWDMFVGDECTCVLCLSVCTRSCETDFLPVSVIAWCVLKDSYQTAC